MNMNDIFRTRARLNRLFRDFFHVREYTEVETPLLAPAVLPETGIELFETRQIIPGKSDRRLFLIPSPEIWMKPLLAEGSGNIFQICRCFRNSEQSGPWHNPEFTMLEWYGTELTDRDNITLLRELFLALDSEFPGCGFSNSVEEYSMEEAFRKWAGFSLESNICFSALADRCEEHSLTVCSDDSEESLFNKLFLTLVEPEIPRDRPVILTRYPALVRTLSETEPGTPWSRRWELYLNGTELANCYTELTDTGLVRCWIDEETAEKGKRALVPVVADTGFADKIVGLPPCSGTALGVDRLLAIILKLNSIGEVIYRPL